MVLIARLLLAILLLQPCLVRGTVVAYDFTEWPAAEDPAGAWAASGLEKASVTGEYKGGLGFNALGDRLRSPRFGGRVLSVTLDVSVSKADPPRILEMFPVVGGETSSSGIPLSAPRLAKNYEEQTIDLSAVVANAFVVEMTGRPNGNWYIRRIVVTFDETSPVEEPPEEESAARPWRLSDFTPKPGFRRADFSALGAIEKKTPWANGVDGDGVMAFSDLGACTNIGRATPKSTTYGLYAFQTNDVNVLAVLGTSGSAMHLVLPVRLDASSRLEKMTVSFVGVCIKRAEPTTLSFSMKAADRLDEINGGIWQELSAGAYDSGDAEASRCVPIDVRALRKRKFVCFRWSVPKQPNSSLLGIADLRLDVETLRPGLWLSFR